MGKRGPAPMAPDDLRQTRVSVYFSPRELAELDDCRGGFGRGEWLRMAGLGALPRAVPQINRNAWVELSRVAANLNQYQRAINEGRASGPIALDELRSSVDALRDELIGVQGES